ncbi:hypothetical protein J1N35_032983 [Gossypium stocksii]|uniref:Uncharacterized protein n=1 Tax=Gossypium stocksii TaxID=47602 RepID=A0A9D3UP68_9ROSI|nr:hypothetical protein J1N35_032983 [Gossypium stocksii]
MGISNVKSITPPSLFAMTAQANIKIAEEQVYLNIDGAVILDLPQLGGYDQVIIFFDCLEVVKAILGSSSTTSNSARIRRIHNILSQEISGLFDTFQRNKTKLRIV